MPVNIKRDPFSGQLIRPSDLSLRTPQARILAALMPEYPEDPVTEWTLVNRRYLGIRAGYTPISGTVTRALNGIKEGSSSGDAHPGLLARGFVEEVVLVIEGTSEINYRITHAGIRAYQKYVDEHGKLPVVKDAATCTNDRYAKKTT